MEMEYGIAVFRSRQQVLMFDRALRAQGLSSRVVSSPPEVAQGCGLSVQFDLSQSQHVREVYDAVRMHNLVGFYKMTVVNGRPQLAPMHSFTRCLR